MAADIRVEVRTDLQERWDEASLAVMSIVDGALDDLADLIAQRIDENIDTMEIHDTGALAASVYVESHVLEKAIIAGAPYAAYVEYGTGPAAGRKSYLPPFAPIYAWVKRNVRISTTGEALFKPGSKAGSRKASDAEARRITQAIRWAIFQRGIRPRPFFRNAVYSSLDAFPALVERRAEAATAQVRGLPG